MEIIIRKALPVDALGVAQVHVKSWQETYRGLISDEYLDNLSVEKREKMWRHWFEEDREDSVSLVAETSAEEIVGFVDGGNVRDDEVVFKGELYALYVLKTYQGRGLGRRLFEEFRRGMQAIGKTSFYLWVLAENPTLDFYRHLGGREHHKRLIEIGGQNLTEMMVSYS